MKQAIIALLLSLSLLGCETSHATYGRLVSLPEEATEEEHLEIYSMIESQTLINEIKEKFQSLTEEQIECFYIRKATLVRGENNKERTIQLWYIAREEVENYAEILEYGKSLLQEKIDLYYSKEKT